MDMSYLIDPREIVYNHDREGLEELMQDCFLHPGRLPEDLKLDISLLLDRARRNLHVFPILERLVRGNRLVVLSDAQPTPLFLKYIDKAALRDSHVVQLSDLTQPEESTDSEDYHPWAEFFKTVPSAVFLSYGDGIEVSVDEQNHCYVRIHSRGCVVQKYVCL